MTDNQAATATAFMQFAEDTRPIYDAANGVKADLLSRGWSPTAAEASAQTWLQEAISFLWFKAREAKA